MIPWLQCLVVISRLLIQQEIGSANLLQHLSVCPSNQTVLLIYRLCYMVRLKTLMEALKKTTNVSILCAIDYFYISIIIIITSLQTRVSNFLLSRTTFCISKIPRIPVKEYFRKRKVYSFVGHTTAQILFNLQNKIQGLYLVSIDWSYFRVPQSNYPYETSAVMKYEPAPWPPIGNTYLQQFFWVIIIISLQKSTSGNMPLLQNAMTKGLTASIHRFFLSFA